MVTHTLAQQCEGGLFPPANGRPWYAGMLDDMVNTVAEPEVNVYLGSLV